MPREISSSATGIYKITTIILVVGCFLFFLNNLLSNVDRETILMLIAMVIIGAFLIRSALSWKKVQLTDSSLIISEISFGKAKEIVVPFEDVLEIRQNIFQRGNTETVIIEFNKPTQFGTKIKFVPKTRHWQMTEHPIVGDLNYQIIGNKILR